MNAFCLVKLRGVVCLVPRTPLLCTHVEPGIFKCFLCPIRGLLVRVLSVSDNCCFLIKVKGNKTFLVSIEPPIHCDQLTRTASLRDLKPLDADTIWGLVRDFFINNAHEEYR